MCCHISLAVFLMSWRATVADILTLLQVGFAWTSVVANTAVSSCLAFSSLLKTTQGYSGYFLLHFPSSRLDLPLASTLLCEARTFLKLSITLNLRPSDQADDYILTRILSLSIPQIKIFYIFLPNNIKIRAFHPHFNLFYRMFLLFYLL